MKCTPSIFVSLVVALAACNKRNMDEEYFAMKDDVLLLAEYCLERPNLHIVRKSSDHGSIKFHCVVRNEFKDQVISKITKEMESKKYLLKKLEQEKTRWCKSDGSVIEVNFTEGLGVLAYLNSTDCAISAQ